MGESGNIYYIFMLLAALLTACTANLCEIIRPLATFKMMNRKIIVIYLGK